MFELYKTDNTEFVYCTDETVERSRPFVYLFLDCYLFICFVYLFLFIHLFIYFIVLSFYLSVRPSVHPSINFRSFIH